LREGHSSVVLAQYAREKGRGEREGGEGETQTWTGVIYGTYFKGRMRRTLIIYINNNNKNKNINDN
jgi:hypothetical protein